MMYSNDTIQKELIELKSILAEIPNINVYTVPFGYFEVLSNDILFTVLQKNLQLPVYGHIPTGYFEGLADSIISKIKSGELAEFTNGEESDLLTTLKGKNVYHVPLGYFDNLAAEIVNKSAQPVKVVEMTKRSSFFNYAAAAVITGILGLSVFSVLNKKQPDNSISPTDISIGVTEDVNNKITEKSIDEKFSALSDADIVTYLQKDGQDVNAALVASIADDKNLPDQIDYLTDDNTLDNLLNELKAVQSTNN